jgi:hypothetical protein
MIQFDDVAIRKIFTDAWGCLGSETKEVRTRGTNSVVSPIVYFVGQGCSCRGCSISGRKLRWDGLCKRHPGS